MKREFLGSILSLLTGAGLVLGQAPSPLAAPVPMPAIAPAVPAPGVPADAVYPTPTAVSEPVPDWRVGPRCVAPAKVWVNGEYLLWWVKNGPLATPLVTASSSPQVTNAAGFNSAAGLGQPGTSVLFGSSNMEYGALSGGRLTAGTWLDDQGVIGLEGSGFMLERGSLSSTFTSGPNGSPLTGIPITDVAGLIGGGENAIANSFPGTFAGSTTVASTSRLWGAESNLLYNLQRNDRWSLTMLAGFRYADLSEGLTINSTSTNLIPVAQGGGVAFLGHFADGTVNATDAFQTRDQFYGGQVGAHTEFCWGKAFLDLTGKVALGSTHEVVDVQGSSMLLTSKGTTSFAPGGTLALPSNSGRFTSDQFSVIPEAEVKLGYNVTRHLRAFVGYDFLYWTNVVRPGDQVNRNVDLSQVPTLPTFNPNAAATQPTSQFNRSNYWAQGVTFGLEFRY